MLPRFSALCCVTVVLFGVAAVLLQLPSFTQGGLGWFTDLTVPDPYMGLPIIAAVITAGMVHSGLLTGASSGLDPKMSKTMQRAGYMGAAVLIPFGYKASSAMALMWVTTSALQLGSALLLKSAGVRALLGLPPEGSVPQPENPMVAWLQNRTKGIEQVAGAAGSSSSGKGGSGVPPPPGNPA
jgi:YidC/Oxa1 family membrane protein insertase